jgi:hypothetical protein
MAPPDFQALITYAPEAICADGLLSLLRILFSGARPKRMERTANTGTGQHLRPLAAGAVQAMRFNGLTPVEFVLTFYSGVGILKNRKSLISRSGRDLAVMAIFVF